MSETRHWSAERCEIAKAYPGKKWQKKVLEMSDSQVHAVYVSVRNRLEKAENDAQILHKSVHKSV